MDPTRHNNTQPNTKSKPSHGTGTTKLHDNYQLIINWYKTNQRDLAGEEIVSNLHIQKLLSILGNPIWNKIYHCWQVELKHMPELQPYVNHKFDATKFVYFIEAYNNN